MRHRFTAWVTTDRTCLASEYCDVVVLVDTITGYRLGSDGEERPIWESAGPEAFRADTDVPFDGDHDDALRKAEELLNAAGWRRTSSWETLTTGAAAPVHFGG